MPCFDKYLICKEKKAGKDGEQFQKAGKGIYVGESSRSLYERAKEHEADKVSRQEDSHQVKHWISNHEDLSSPPKFEFKIVRTFKNPRQLSEAIRIEKIARRTTGAKDFYFLQYRIKPRKI